MLRFEPDEDALFVGIEQEGRHKGLQTLFVVNEPPMDTVYSELVMHDAKQIYLGAGFLSKPSPEYVMGMSDFLSERTCRRPVLTLESDSLDFLAVCGLFEKNNSRTGLNFVVTLVMEGKVSESLHQLVRAFPYMLESTQIKVDLLSKTFMVPVSSLVTSSYNQYSGDKLLWSSITERQTT